MTREEQHSRHDAMREYKAQGHTVQEVAELFGVSNQTAQRACKGVAVDSGRTIRAEKASVTLLHKNITTRDSRAFDFVAKYAPDFEYVGGYTDRQGYAVLRCNVCGHVMRRTCWAWRKLSPKCENCQRIEAEASKAKEAERKRISKEQDAIERQKRIAELNADRLKRAEERWHDCPVCGKGTARPKYCSNDCRRKAENASREARRRAKINDAMIDNDITLSALFKRDGGVCHICGGRCSYEDYTTRRGQKISGDWYPSIDHVVPLAKGGEHSWQNVKLAHRRCNYIKRDMPPIK